MIREEDVNIYPNGDIEVYVEFEEEAGWIMLSKEAIDKIKASSIKH